MTMRRLRSCWRRTKGVCSDGDLGWRFLVVGERSSPLSWRDADDDAQGTQRLARKLDVGGGFCSGGIEVSTTP